MTSTSFLKTAFLSGLMATSALSGTACASSPQLIERDAEGFFKEPSCDYHFYIKRGLSNFSGETPTGIKAQNEKWDMEIYADPADGSWTLVGKSRDPKANSSFLCKIANGMSPAPYAQQVWYRNYFDKRNAPDETGGRPPPVAP